MGTPDFGKTALDYSKYRQGFPKEFFERLHKFGIGKKDQKILDLGTGTGTIARGLALMGSEVTALDISDHLINEAKKLDKEAGVSINYVIASAENTKLPANYFDVVTAGQCWHWFDHDKTITEIKRSLKPHGKLVIAHNNFIALKNNVAALTDKIILKFGSKITFHHQKHGFYTEWVSPLNEAGFENIETFSFDYIAQYSHKAWRGRIRASAPVGGSLLLQKVAEFDTIHAKELKKHFPDEPLKILHRCFVIIASLN